MGRTHVSGLAFDIDYSCKSDRSLKLHDIVHLDASERVLFLYFGLNK